VSGERRPQPLLPSNVPLYFSVVAQDGHADTPRPFGALLGSSWVVYCYGPPPVVLEQSPVGPAAFSLATGLPSASMQTSPPLRLTSGEIVYHRLGDQADPSGSPAPAAWFVIERPGRVELLIGIDEGMTVNELTRMFERVIGPAGALEVIRRFQLRVSDSGVIEKRDYRPDQPSEPLNSHPEPTRALALVRNDRPEGQGPGRGSGRFDLPPS
jgi:hypothetical protein